MTKLPQHPLNVKRSGSPVMELRAIITQTGVNAPVLVQSGLRNGFYRSNTVGSTISGPLVLGRLGVGQYYVSQNYLAGFNRSVIYNAIIVSSGTAQSAKWVPFNVSSTRFYVYDGAGALVDLEGTAYLTLRTLLSSRYEM